VLVAHQHNTLMQQIIYAKIVQLLLLIVYLVLAIQVVYLA